MSTTINCLTSAIIPYDCIRWSALLIISTRRRMVLSLMSCTRRRSDHNNLTPRHRAWSLTPVPTLLC